MNKVILEVNPKPKYKNLIITTFARMPDKEAQNVVIVITEDKSTSISFIQILLFKLTLLLAYSKSQKSADV
ncbi:unnamed protein product [Medioppia subpectinata]|uniref:Uncharacterized protein n=1 Tax=Medioppia subpectinata TaxID=1979941 RepID=A0A7R9KT09_9ACAR|nr:unnamed protein product [Medioppia subpectinata]CAG2109280.1 unnamed protein product [Medioppia subpectinata]